jgi:hypothetical protein
MGNPTRFKNGVTNNSGAGIVTSNMPIPDYTNINVYQDDFNHYVASDWTVVAGGAGSGTAIGANGGMVLTWATSGIQSNKLAAASWYFNPATSSKAGQQIWFEAGVVPSDGSAPRFEMGLTNGTPNASTDGVWFTKAAAGRVWQLNIRTASGTPSVFNLPTIANTVDTALASLGYYYDGKPTPTLYVYFGGTVGGVVGNYMIGAVTPAGATGGVTFVSGTNDLTALPASTMGLAPSFSIATAVGTFNVDYLTAACEIYNRV